MTRKLRQPYRRKSDEACFIFLVTFWNYPARGKDWLSKKKKEEKQKSDEKFSTVSCRFPQKTYKKKKNKKKVTRNFRLSLAGFLKRPMRIKKKKKKKKRRKKVTRNFQLSHLGKSDRPCFKFLVTFWNYPARSKVSKGRRKKNKKTK